MQNAKHKTIWSDELGATRDIRIAVSELQLIVKHLSKSKNDDIQFIVGMIESAIENDDQDALNDFTA